jgi:7-cyano-7-deazaguanine synthase
MCAIVGALLRNDISRSDVLDANYRLNHIFRKSMERGRDGRGWYSRAMHYAAHTVDATRIPGRDEFWGDDVKFFEQGDMPLHLIGNLRAEPTTEFVRDKMMTDQQPYCDGPWQIVHNGTIAHDKDLRTDTLITQVDSAAIVEHLAAYETRGLSIDGLIAYFEEAIKDIKGSYAILATHDEHPGIMFVACNYRPVWYAEAASGWYFASARHYFPDDMVPRMVEPYTVSVVDERGLRRVGQLREPANHKALVVCSGGLDSVVSAAWALAEGYDITLLHFMYGSRAEGPEVQAVQAVAKELDCEVQLFPLPIYKPSDSPLLQADSTIAGGEAGAEFAHEWVPARNLAMLAIATAVAEAGGFDTIVLGNNLEEAGAYPDNEPEFIAKFNDILPFAVGDGKRVEVVMPVGNMMKHEIVAMGHQLKAPLDKTWSCYRAGHVHCGTCGPCYMRRTAFEINGLPEVISYANERTES